MAAPKKSLGILHEKFTQLLLDELEFYLNNEEGIPMSAADKTVVMTFLKNNGITAESSDEELAALNNAWNQLKQDKQAKALDVLRKAQESLQEGATAVAVKPREPVGEQQQQVLQRFIS